MSDVKSSIDPSRTLWVFRYDDLDDRRFETYGKALVRLISFFNTSRDRPRAPVPGDTRSF